MEKLVNQFSINFPKFIIKTCILGSQERWICYLVCITDKIHHIPRVYYLTTFINPSMLMRIQKLHIFQQMVEREWIEDWSRFVDYLLFPSFHFSRQSPFHFILFFLFYPQSH